ncbi:LysR family transcriptional regulator [Paraburkholderia silviterrae]|uniref:LysR family transcriptional regulator n=1 Tax=Paraburkholderia silviterrae TaxID=2528715 RepID=A0A4R5MAD0_9BURK|nr:LysR family transcriptional regulator [Paraburkholderia silviterrae]TDG23311.1 LysR family transcriptional regulator [Paraburkholderia silviterrae]
MNRQHEWPAADRIDLNLFRVFEAVYRERNLTRAAAILHLSQSAISHALARLREQIGDPLFVREGRGVAPTPEARRLAPAITEALGLLQDSVGRLREFDPDRDARCFTLSMPEQLEPMLLPAIVADLRARAPLARVRSGGVRWAELKLEMAAGQIDLAIEIARPADAELNQCQLLSEPLCVVVGPQFRGELTAQRYLDAQHIAVTSRRRGISVEDLALERVGLSRNVVHRCQHYLAASLVAAQSDLLLTMVERYARLINAPLGNRVLPMPLDLPPVSLNLYWHERTGNEPGNRWLRERVRQACARGGSALVRSPDVDRTGAGDGESAARGAAD